MPKRSPESPSEKLSGESSRDGTPAPGRERSALIVMGMHRSGTSAVSRILNLLGADLPSRLLEPRPDNELGFWESAEVHALHTSLLESAQSSWDDVLRIPDSWYESAPAKRIEQEVSQVLERDFEQSPLFVVKDPRISRIVPFWISVLRRLDVKAHFIIAVRNPLEVAASLERRNGFSIEKSVLLWLRHLLDAEGHTREINRLFVSYSDILEDWRGFVEAMSQEFDLEAPRQVDEVAGEVGAFLSKDLRHHSYTTRQLMESESVCGWAKQAYSALLEPPLGKSATLCSVFDDIRLQLDASDRVFAPIFKEQLAQIRDELGEEGQRNRRLTAQRNELTESLEASRTELQHLQVAVEQLEGDVLERDKRLSASADLLAAEGQLSNRYRMQLDRVHGELEEESRRSRRLTTQRKELTEKLEASRTELQQIRSTVEQLEESVLERDRRLSESAELLRAEEQNSSRYKKQLARITGRLGAETRKSQRLTAQRKRLTEELESSRTELQQVQSAVERLEKNVVERDRRLGAKNRLLTAAKVRTSSLEEVVTRLEDQVVKVYAENGAWRARVSKLRHLTQSQQTQLTYMLTSKSWLATRPLRRLYSSVVSGPSPGKESARETSVVWSNELLESCVLFDEGHYVRQRGKLGPQEGTAAEDYLRVGGQSLIDPHPLFDSEYYMTQVESGDGKPVVPLQHYLMANARGVHLNPHPLFDATFYLSQDPSSGEQNIDPLAHYLTTGFKEGLDPHPLFDTSFYLSSSQEVAESGMAPLLHFVQLGALAGRDPHPLFSTSFYLEGDPELGTGAAANPLVHYLLNGAREGRDPHPAFDTAQYLAQYPDVAENGMNPLLHFALSGASEGRSPKPSSRSLVLEGADESMWSDGEPIESPVGDAEGFPIIRSRNLGAAAETMERIPTVLCVSHVVPWPPRAGNEYRLLRLLRWLREEGYRVVVLLAPLRGEEAGDEQLRRLAEDFGNVVQCLPDGSVSYALRDLDAPVAALDGRLVRPEEAIAGEDALTVARPETLDLDRTFCHDALVAVAKLLEASLAPCVVLTQYVWMSRLLPLMRRDCLKIIDTIDVFSTKRDKVLEHGVSDIWLSAEEEASRLRLADMVIAIQKDEREILADLVPDRKVVTVGVDFDITESYETPSGNTVLCVGSGNALNLKGLRDFLRFAWPLVRRDVPDAQLTVAGKVGTAVSGRQEGVTVLGSVEDLGPLYREASVVVNPSIAGTGLKIKTMEAVSHLRPVVCWPNGVEGLEGKVAEACQVAKDWYDFYLQIVLILRDPRQEGFSPAARSAIARESSAEHVYEPLAEELRRFFSTRRHTPPLGEQGGS